jgi:hypothetical protein
MKKHWISAAVLFGMALALALGVTASDNRHLDMRFPVAKYSATQMSLVAADANDVTTTIANLNGLIERIDIISSDANTTGQTYSVALEDEDGTDLASFTSISMDSAVATMKLATSDATDFNAVPSAGDVVITVNPSSGPTGVTWTIQLHIFVE